MKIEARYLHAVDLALLPTDDTPHGRGPWKWRIVEAVMPVTRIIWGDGLERREIRSEGVAVVVQPSQLIDADIPADELTMGMLAS